MHIPNIYVLNINRPWDEPSGDESSEHRKRDKGRKYAKTKIKKYK